MNTSTAKKITVVPPSVSLVCNAPLSAAHKKRVAGYARVSTDQEEQQNSYAAQVDYYTQKITENPQYAFVRVYTDEGISATSTAKREGFKTMVADALAGKIDLILTKSVSRFARNTVDSLQTIRDLKAAGVEVYFEKENIWTFDGKGELLITIMASLAQEESRSISENVTWGKRKAMADGKISLPYAQFLGYEKGEDGLPKIVESEAAVVRLIYALFLEGHNFGGIAAILEERGVPSPGGNDKWHPTTIQSILKNEKYAGNALLQKTFCEDFLSKRMKKNNGEIPQYFVENSHPAIVTEEVFDLVQDEIAKQQSAEHRRAGGAHCFAGRVFCGGCGKPFAPKTWQSTNKYRRRIWQCSGRYVRGKSGAQCDISHVTAEAVEAAFVTAFNTLSADKSAICAVFDAALPLLADMSKLDKEAEDLTEEREILADRLRRCVEENARTAQDQEAYQAKFDELESRYTAVRERLDSLTAERQERTARREKTMRFLDELRGADDILTAFDESLWRRTVDRVEVHSATGMAVIFRDGSRVDV